MAHMVSFILMWFVCGITSARLIPGYRRGVPSGYWYFKLHPTPKTWHEASLTCQSENAQLAVINSPEEAKMYADEMARYSPSSIADRFRKDVPAWHKDVVSLGFHKKFVRGDWITLDGTPLADTGYAQWAVNQPDNDGYCGSMFRNSFLNDLPCNEPFMYICETTYPYFEEKVIAFEPKCETYELGYRMGAHIGDRFFKLHLEALTWDEASLKCQTEKAKLAVINSDDEAQAYVAELKKHPMDTIPGDFNKVAVMLGFHDRFEHGNFITLNGTPLKQSGYNKWSKDQPDNAGKNEHCGSMFWDGLLNDLPCNTPFMFICEKPYIDTDNFQLKETCSENNSRILHDFDVNHDFKCETYDMDYRLGISHHGNNKYYKLHLDPKTWDEALLVCQSEQASLAVINSPEESALFVEAMARHPPSTIPGAESKDVALLGFHDRLIPGKFITIDGRALSGVGFNTWAAGQPDNTNGVEHCGSMFRNGRLNDVSCDSPCLFFCEKSSVNTYVTAN